MSRSKSELVPRRCFFCGSFILFMFRVWHAFFNAALWSPAGKGLTAWLSFVWCFVVFCHFRVWCPGSGVILDSTDWYWTPYLLTLSVDIDIHEASLLFYQRTQVDQSSVTFLANASPPKPLNVATSNFVSAHESYNGIFLLLHLLLNNWTLQLHTLQAQL